MNRSAKFFLPLVLASSLGLLVSGCTSGDPDASATGASSGPSSSASASASTSPGGSASPSASASAPAEPSATPGPDGASGGGGDLGDGASGDASARCTVDELSAEIADGGGGAAGSYGIAFVFTNTGDRTCTLQGWPGVSFVGGGDGTQIGASATLDRGTPHETQSLAPGGEVQALVKIVQTGGFDAASCQPTATDGFRIYPPGSVRSIFVGASGSSFEACANTAVQQLSTSALAAF